MFDVGFFELLIIFVIGLLVLGPERLPKVASKVGSWVGQARRMTRNLKYQLEDEIAFSERKAAAEKFVSDIDKDIKGAMSVDPQPPTSTGSAATTTPPSTTPPPTAAPAADAPAATSAEPAPAATGKDA